MSKTPPGDGNRGMSRTPRREAHARQGPRSGGRGSALAFTLGLFCFILPFVSVSCQGRSLAIVSGYELVTGFTVEEPQVFGPPKQRHVRPEPMILSAAVCGALGLLGGLFGRRAAAFASLAGALGIVLLVAFKLRADRVLIANGWRLLVLQLEPGFWLVCLAYGAGAVLSYLRYADREDLQRRWS